MARRVVSYFTDPSEALGMCAITSTEFSSRVRGWGMVRVTGLTYPGREHWASLFTGGVPASEDLSEALVRDGTLRQFSPTVRALWKGSLDDWLDDLSELLCDHLHYECFADPITREPFFADDWIREDIEPGPMTFRPHRVSA